MMENYILENRDLLIVSYGTFSKRFRGCPLAPAANMGTVAIENSYMRACGLILATLNKKLNVVGGMGPVGKIRGLKWF